MTDQPKVRLLAHYSDYRRIEFVNERTVTIASESEHGERIVGLQLIIQDRGDYGGAADVTFTDLDGGALARVPLVVAERGFTLPMPIALCGTSLYAAEGAQAIRIGLPDLTKLGVGVYKFNSPFHFVLLLFVVRKRELVIPQKGQLNG